MFRPFVSAAVAGALLLTFFANARAEETRGPVVVTLESADRIARERAFDVLAAESSIRGAAGDLRTAKVVTNPIFSPSIVRSWGSGNCDGCSDYTFGATVTEPSALSDLVSGKRRLRVRVAEEALDETKASKDDAVRQVVSDAKTQVVALAGAQRTRNLLVDIAASLGQSVELAKKRYPQVINEGDLARIEREKLTADSAVDRANADIANAQANLAFALGERGPDVPTFAVSEDVLRFRLPDSLAQTTSPALARRALAARPDLRAANIEIARTDAAVAVADRSRIPDIGWSLGYTHVGAGQPSSATLGVAIPIPFFDQKKGVRDRAQADRSNAEIQRERTAARVVADVNTAYGSFDGWRRVVARMDGELLERAKKARDITEIQYRAGSASLIDYLDAQRSYTQTVTDYTAALVGYWSSVFALEAAVGEHIS